MNDINKYPKGSVTRRHFLGVTGLGMAVAVLGQAMPLLRPRVAYGAISGKVSLCTWPNYHSQANLDQFTKDTGVPIQVTIFGSNEEMLAKLQAGGTGWDVFVPTNYTISTYVKLGLIDPLDTSKLPNFDASAHDPRFTDAGTVDGKLYAVPKDWGTTGFAINTKSVNPQLSSWKEFWDKAQTDYSGKVTVHDYQLTTIGNALKYFGYSFNSVDPKELAEAEKLLLAVKPHLFAITSDYQPAMRNGDAVMCMCWTGDAVQMSRDLPEIKYVIGKEGGEIWTDFYAVPKEAPNKDAAYALIDFLQTPAVNAREVEAHGYPPTDKRVSSLLPDTITSNPVLYPAAELLTNLEFGAAVTVTDPARAELIARFKSA
ncbi:MAG: spermidine/putrescine ABC transporter substrate-binding protein [Pseudomonadota bacterium]|nr:spermidine/putrescine ABC transporter substrate-binding protein [Pseudomonadota bacterium]